MLSLIGFTQKFGDGYKLNLTATFSLETNSRVSTTFRIVTEAPMLHRKLRNAIGTVPSADSHPFMIDSLPLVAANPFAYNK
jgi:hypothetical protein